MKEIITRLFLTLVIILISVLWRSGADFSQMSSNQIAGFRICNILFLVLGIAAAWGEKDGYFDGKNNNI